MKQTFTTYTRYIEKEISAIKQNLQSTNQIERLQAVKDAKRLEEYHHETVHNYQHERLIHLMVTLFFASLMLLAAIGVFVFSLCYNDQLLTAPTIIICAILLVTELFYIKYYYYLENGTQKLYHFDQELYELVTSQRLQK